MSETGERRRMRKRGEGCVRKEYCERENGKRVREEKRRV